MKSSVETLSPTRVRLTVEVPFDELKPQLDAAYRKIGQGIRIPGFRPGKVPARIIDQRLGRGAVLEETLQTAVPKFYGDAIRDNEVAVLGQPAIEVTDLTDGQQVAFTAEVDVRPEITLPAYDELAVTVDDIAIEDSEIDEQLSGLQDRFATLSGVERPVETGDYVSLDLTATVDGEAVPGGEATGLSYEVGTGTLVPGIDDVLIGMSEGDATTFESELVAGEYADKAAQVAVTVRSVKTKDVPALDDDFAQTASEFDTIAELRADVRTRVERYKRLEQGISARDKVLEALMAAVEVTVPETILEAELDWRRNSVQQQLGESGMTLEGWLEAEGKTAEEHEAELRKASEDAIASQLVLDSIADREELGVEEGELTEQVVRRAQQMQISPEDYAQQVVANGQIGAMVAEVRRAKALALVLDQAAITDASGRVVDLEALRESGPDEVAQDAADDEATDSDAIDTDAEANEPTGVPEESTTEEPAQA